MVRLRLSLRATLLGAATVLATPRVRAQAAIRLVIVGGGFGGASGARFACDRFTEVEVTLIERSRPFMTSPYGNLVLGGKRRIEEISFTYDGLTRRGVRLVRCTTARPRSTPRARPCGWRAARPFPSTG